MKEVLLYTDGACSGNPGAGGFGAILKYMDKEKIISCGFKNTTNNRMELMAVIAGLKALNQPCRVTLFSDSAYVINALSKGWAKSWRANGWKRKDGMAQNIDLWEQLLSETEKHEMEYIWIKGHSGNSENERCDKLAISAYTEGNLIEDVGYKK